MEITVHAPVSKYVLRGADVMLPGVVPPEKGFGYMRAGQPRVVTIPNNPFPIAIGKMLIGTEDVEKSGMKGKALQVVHHFRDELWSLCGKECPNAGFQAGADEVEECTDGSFRDGAAGEAKDDADDAGFQAGADEVEECTD